MRASKFTPALFLAAALVLAGAGCSLLQKGEETVTKVSKSPVVKTAVALRNTFADISDEEEYYIGRSVSALILAKYPVYENESLTRYVNQVGCAVAAFSNRPETFAGYHFLVLNSDEINAFAAPGGFIFITKGLLTQCRDEEMLASVLAHEVGHVNGRHGLQAIKQSRLIDTFKVLGAQAAAKYSPAEVAQLTDLFQGALSDIAGQLIEKGYDRKLEYEADAMSLKFTNATGYNPNGLLDFLQTLAKETGKEGDKGLFRTHPTPDQRIEKVRMQISSLNTVPKKEPARTQRFKKAMAGLK
jgi:predicted Zn-dependent protease